MGGLVLAMIAGVLVPVIGILAVAAANPVPRDCSTGQATSTSLEGALLYSTGADLWYSEGFPGRPRKLVDYNPPRTRPTPGTTPSASAAVASAVPSSAPSASPSPVQPSPRVLAADISLDRKTVALLVLDAPNHQGGLILQLVSPGDAPGTPPVELGFDTGVDRKALNAFGVRFLATGKVLVFKPELKPVTGVFPPPSTPAAPAAPAATAPSPSPSGTPSPRPSPTPRAFVSGSASVDAEIIAPGPTPLVVDSASQQYLFSQGRAAWPDARGYEPPALLPGIRSRVDGATASAGIGTREITTPLLTKRLNQLVLGVAGEPGTRALCDLDGGTTPAVFSPDESRLALLQSGQTVVLDLSGAHSISHLLDGVLLAWRS
ncbi:MAG: hypothetical protein QOK05_2555 [Chloroflexota bacterium]|jgi:hypothetical protein|nr:hypothetical protein [Chloroflexota bacterium]